MRIRRHLLNAFTGWIAGAGATLLCGLMGLLAFPGLVRANHYAYAIPGLPTVLGVVLLLVSPLALLGGLLGGRLPQEGGQSEQIGAALICGALIALPAACIGLWYFSGP
jgi:hypothetical protein